MASSCSTRSHAAISAHTTLEAVVLEALNFPIPLVEVQPGLFSLELFHGPTFAFKDVGARVMARLMASRHRGDDPLTILAATSGDTGSAVAHAFHGVPNTRVVILYPDGRVSPTQEAQLTVFNGERSNVRAYAVAGSFDDCHKLTREAYADPDLRRSMRLTSANSVNVGRLLPQAIYYFHALAQLRNIRGAVPNVVFCTPSGNFGNLTAGLIAKRAGLSISRFVAATNANDVVPAYLDTGRFEPRASVTTISNAMDVGHPSNFDRMLWLYGGDVDAMRGTSPAADSATTMCARQSSACTKSAATCSTRIARLHTWGWPGGIRRTGRTAAGRAGSRRSDFLSTAHPAKFAEIVEPIIGRAVEKPPALAAALNGPQHIIRIRASLDRVLGMLDG